MRKFGKWFLVSLILILIIGWNVNCGGYSEKKEAERRIKIIESEIGAEIEPVEKPQSLLITKGCVDEDCVNKFLDRILDKLLQKVSMIKKGIPSPMECEYVTGKYYVTRILLSDQRRWAGYWSGEDFIIVGSSLLLLAQNEAEIAAVITHEVGHCALQYIWPQSILQPDSEESKKDEIEEEEMADRIGVILMSKSGYDAISAIDILQRIDETVRNVKGKEIKEKIDALLKEKGTEKRIDALRKNAKKYFKENQKKWISFSSEDLEKIKEFLQRRNSK